MSNIDQFGKDDPEPWKPNDTEYALYEDIDRTEIKGYGDDETEDDDETDDEKSSVTSSNSSTTTTSSTATTTPRTTVTRPKRMKQPKPRKTYTKVLQEDTDFMDEKYTIPKKI